MNIKKRIKVLHIVKWFYAGGAERIVSSILTHSNNDEFEHIILSLSDQGERLEKVKDTLNIDYQSINIERGKWNLKKYIWCFNFVRKINPDVIKCWLPPANKVGGFIGKLLWKPVIWGVHSARSKEFQDRVQYRLSNFLPKKIICCSSAVEKNCIELGYKKNLLNVILNGTDADIFFFQQEGRMKVRRELGYSDSDIVIGLAAEYSDVKRHNYFLNAAQLLSEKRPDVKFILCGKNVNSENPFLTYKIKSLNISNNVNLLGIRDDMPNIFSAMDISTLVSSSESFGLTITESMACETLCVATKVGIMPNLLKNVGELIPVVDDPNILCEAWLRILNLTNEEKQNRVKLGRKRVIEDYSIKTTAKQYDKLFAMIANNH